MSSPKVVRRLVQSTVKLTKHILVKLPLVGGEPCIALSKNFNSGDQQDFFLATIFLQLEVGEFPKGGPWGQFNEASRNITPANPSGNKKVTFCT
jgi:hypothetical protein